MDSHELIFQPFYLSVTDLACLGRLIQWVNVLHKLYKQSHAPLIMVTNNAAKHQTLVIVLTAVVIHLRKMSSPRLKSKTPAIPKHLHCPTYAVCKRNQTIMREPGTQRDSDQILLSPQLFSRRLHCLQWLYWSHCSCSSMPDSSPMS